MRYILACALALAGCAGPAIGAGVPLDVRVHCEELVEEMMVREHVPATDHTIRIVGLESCFEAYKGER